MAKEMASRIVDESEKLENLFASVGTGEKSAEKCFRFEFTRGLSMAERTAHVVKFGRYVGSDILAVTERDNGDVLVVGFTDVPSDLSSGPWKIFDDGDRVVGCVKRYLQNVTMFVGKADMPTGNTFLRQRIAERLRNVCATARLVVLEPGTTDFGGRMVLNGVWRAFVSDWKGLDAFDVKTEAGEVLRFRAPSRALPATQPQIDKKKMQQKARRRARREKFKMNAAVRGRAPDVENDFDSPVPAVPPAFQALLAFAERHPPPGFGEERRDLGGATDPPRQDVLTGESSDGVVGKKVQRKSARRQGKLS